MQIHEFFIILGIIYFAFINSLFVWFYYHMRKRDRLEGHIVVGKRDMELSEILSIISTVQEELFINKYFLLYDLSDRTYVDIEKETRNIAFEVYSIISPNVLNQALYYVSAEYIIQLISRNVQRTLIEWLKKNKPEML